jgi:membrane-associated phospholipid phosphatase
MAIVGLGLVDALLAHWAGMRFRGWDRFGVIAALPVAVAIYYRVSHRSERLADAGYYVSMWLAFSVCGCILTYLAARIDLSLWDDQLAQFDTLLCFDWNHWTTFIISHPKVELVLALAYSTILPQTMGSVIYFSHIRRQDRNDDLLWTTMFAALVTTVISALVPAMGPHLKGQYVEWSATLAAIRNHSVSIFWLPHLQGIIDFPSFHTVAAIVLVYSHRPPLHSFRAILLLNMLVLLSIPSEGQHYLVDIISGAIVAATSIAAVRLVLRSRGTTRDYSINPA